MLLVSLNMSREYCLALTYLKLYALKESVVREHVNIDIFETGVNKHIVKTIVRIIKRRPDLVAFSCNIWNITRTLRVAKQIKRFSRARIILGGQEVTNSYIDYLETYPFIDIIVDGEGESTFSELLLDFVETDFARLKDIRGIQYRDHNRIFRNPPRPLIDDLNTIPSPYLDGSLPIDNSYHLGMMVEFSRGCVHRCRFCFEGNKYDRTRTFPVERLREEMAVMKRLGMKKFHILDPILGNADPKKLKAIHHIIDTLFDHDEPFFIPVEVYAEYISNKNVRYLDSFSAFDVGLQTIHPDVQVNIGRAFHPKKFLRGFRLLQTLGKETNIYILIGLPGDNFFRLMETVRFVVRINPTFIYTNYLLILNGSGLREDIEKFNIRFDPKPPYEIISNRTFPERELKIARLFSENMMKAFNLNTTLMRKVSR